MVKGENFSSIKLEAELQEKLRDSKDAEEGVAAFFEKREANFTGE